MGSSSIRYLHGVRGRARRDRVQRAPPAGRPRCAGQIPDVAAASLPDAVDQARRADECVRRQAEGAPTGALAGRRDLRRTHRLSYSPRRPGAKRLLGREFLPPPGKQLRSIIEPIISGSQSRTKLILPKNGPYVKGQNPTPRSRRPFILASLLRLPIDALLGGISTESRRRVARKRGNADPGSAVRTSAPVRVVAAQRRAHPRCRHRRRSKQMGRSAGHECDRAASRVDPRARSTGGTRVGRGSPRGLERSRSRSALRAPRSRVSCWSTAERSARAGRTARWARLAVDSDGGRARAVGYRSAHRRAGGGGARRREPVDDALGRWATTRRNVAGPR